MFSRLIILAALFLASEKVNSQPLLGFLMLFSDALPVQLWPVNCSTYNEHEAQGVHHKCFCAPWECDDEIKIQGQDGAGLDFSLLVYNSEGQPIDSIDFDEVSPGYYQVAFIPSENSPGFCDQQIQLKIQQKAGSQSVTLPALSTWLSSTDSGSEPDWTTGVAPTVSIVGASGISPITTENLYTDFAFIPGIQYTIDFNFTRVTNSGTENPRVATIEITDNAFSVQFSQAISSNEGANAIQIIFTATVNTTRIAFHYTSGKDVTLTANSVSGVRVVGADTIVAKSDCLDLRITQPNTVLLNYYNHRNFAGLNYEATSPEHDFNIRVPAIFFHQRFPEEDEVMELSSSLVTLNGTLRKQRLLELDYVPYYFHEKVKLILKHQFITMLDRQWVKQEGYEILEGDRKWPVKKAKCWLSEKDFVHRNIL